MKCLFFALAAFCVVGCAAKPQQSTTNRRPCAIFHANGVPCPPGTERYHKMFTEGDGTTEDACHDANAEDECIDEIRPGESVSLVIQIPIPHEVEQPKPKPARGKT